MGNLHIKVTRTEDRWVDGAAGKQLESMPQEGTGIGWEREAREGCIADVVGATLATLRIQNALFTD